MFKNEVRRNNLLWKWPWNPSIYIHTHLMEQKISVEEATLIVILKESNIIWDDENFKKLIFAYEEEKNAQKQGETLINSKTGERIPFPKYPIKDKKKYNLFKKIYKIAKKDLDESGKISDKTLEKVRKMVMAVDS